MHAALITLHLITGLTLGQYAPQRLAGEPLPEAQEARVQALASGLRCAVCQGVAIADSPSSMARAQLERVRELVAEGKSDEEVVDYFVARYGEWVLLEPEVSGVNLIVWAGPLVLVLLGLVVIARQVKGDQDALEEQLSEGAPKPAAGPSEADADLARYLEAVRKETDR
jgi:cytochrome c-type biogenesis protein CcmH